MQKKVLTKRAVFFVFAASAAVIAAGCEVSHNGNTAAVWEKEKTGNAVNVNATLSPLATPSASPTPTPASSPTPFVSPTPAANIPPSADEPAPSDKSVTAVMPADKLIIPVVGIKPDELRDTFKDARSEGRVHDAIDIMAKKGTPVVAAADGEIARFFDSERGGITIYQYSRDKKMIYYYAHLDKRADNLREKEFVKQGTIIGYVGDTGNAGAGNDHLHFAIWVIEDPKRYWDGVNINPYPLLRQ